MLKLQRSSNGKVILALSGQIDDQDITELETQIRSEEKGRSIALDLKDLTLVGRDAIGFLERCEADSVTLRNCAAYVREWITRLRRGHVIDGCSADYLCAHLAQMSEHATESALPHLQPRERDVLRLLVGANTNKDIARDLGMSVQVVKNYLKRIYDVLGVNNRLEAAMWVVNHPEFNQALTTERH